MSMPAHAQTGPQPDLLSGLTLLAAHTRGGAVHDERSSWWACWVTAGSTSCLNRVPPPLTQSAFAVPSDLGQCGVATDQDRGFRGASEGVGSAGGTADEGGDRFPAELWLLLHELGCELAQGCGELLVVGFPVGELVGEPGLHGCDDLAHLVLAGWGEAELPVLSVQVAVDYRVLARGLEYRGGQVIPVADFLQADVPAEAGAQIELADNPGIGGVERCSRAGPAPGQFGAALMLDEPADGQLQLLVRVAAFRHSETFANGRGCFAGGTAQRHLLEEQREHERDDGHRDCGQEDDVDGVGVRVDDG